MKFSPLPVKSHLSAKSHKVKERNLVEVDDDKGVLERIPIPNRVCHKCAVPFNPMCAKSLLFNTELDRFRAGLIVGKLLMFNGASTRKTLSD